jgi:uncharacterized protein (TIGR04255 family)
MLDQSTLDEVFPNNPLVEVAAEIRFPVSLRVLRDVCDIQDDLGPEYSEVVREEVQIPNGPTRVSYSFTNLALGRTIKVSEDRVAIVFMQYERFETYVSDVIAYMRKFCGLMRIERLTRVGLRYVNNIHIPDDGGVMRLTDYVRPHINPVRIIPEDLVQYRTEVLHQKDEFLLNSRTAFPVRFDSPEVAFYVLDIDAFIVGERKLADLGDVFGKLHHHIQVEFLGHITEAYKHEMRRVE